MQRAKNVSSTGEKSQASGFIPIWTLNLVKGLLADSDTLSKIAKKVWVIWKNCKYVFCSFWCDLFEKNILVNICWPRCWLNWVELQKSAKFPAKNTKYVNGRGVFLLWGIWPQYLEKRHFKASFRRSQTHMVPMWVHTSESKVKNRGKCDFGLILVPFTWYSGFLHILRGY